jgi:hypothetical protein
MDIVILNLKLGWLTLNFVSYIRDKKVTNYTKLYRTRIIYNTTNILQAPGTKQLAPAREKWTIFCVPADAAKWVIFAPTYSPAQKPAKLHVFG